MEREFVPYKIALALKELGFDESCFGFYSQNNSLIYYQDSPNDYNYLEEAIQNIYAPTFSQAFRWFREKYNLFCEIQIDRTTDPKFCFDIFQYEHFGNYKEIGIGEWYLYRTQEEAELECLKKLIEIVKEK
jgi:hypothetical protein